MKQLLLMVVVCLSFSARADEGSDVRALAAKFNEAWNRHDARAMAAVYAVDGTLVDPFASMKGQAELEKGLGGMMAGPGKASRSTLEVRSIERVAADLVLADAEQVVEGMAAPDGKQVGSQKFKVAMLVAKKGGRWEFRAVRVIQAADPH